LKKTAVSYWELIKKKAEPMSEKSIENLKAEVLILSKEANKGKDN